MNKTLTDKLAEALRKAASHLPALHAHNTNEEHAQAMVLLAEYDATVDFTPRIVITMEGGIMQDLSSNLPIMDVVTVDYDTEGNPPEALASVAQLNQKGVVTGHEDAVICSGTVEYNPALVETRFAEAQAFEEREP